MVAGMFPTQAPFRQRRSSFWCRTFETARQAGDWTLVERTYSRSTAAQLASDINNAHRREEDYQRVRGIGVGEVWEARWDHAAQSDTGRFRVWIRLQPSEE
ncbi:MAG: hypothetical protein RI900_1170 [Actinomycetota bacterium]|jgi:hypothetical protein